MGTKLCDWKGPLVDCQEVAVGVWRAQSAAGAGCDVSRAFCQAHGDALFQQGWERVPGS